LRHTFKLFLNWKNSNRFHNTENWEKPKKPNSKNCTENQDQ